MAEHRAAGGRTGDRWEPVVAGHLGWIRDALDGLRLAAERRDPLRAGLRAVEERLADPELRIAVFGETSSGKSTLLNAFLRRRLLPSSALVTTRTTTVLRYADGDGEGLRVRTLEGAELAWPSGSFSRWADHAPSGGAEGLARALERVLTSELADQVDRLEVRCPVRPLGAEITLLDTPGFSVTDAGHRELATAAARQADLALVVVPAVAAMSMTLTDFLEGPLQDHHDRCVFVLTKMDLLDEADRDEIVAVVEHRLRELGLQAPVLLPCAPGRALRELLAGGGTPAGAGTGPGGSDGGRARADRTGVGGAGALAGGAGHGQRHGCSEQDEHVWRFLTVEARIAELAAQTRQSAIAATVLGLLSELLTAVQEAADARTAELGRRDAELAALSLPDFSAFLKSWYDRTERLADQELEQAALLVRSSAKRAPLDAEIAEAVAGPKINHLSNASEDVSRIVRTHLRREAELTVGTAAERSAALLESAADELARDFHDQFSALSRLAGETGPTPAPPPPTRIELPAPDLSDLDRTLAAIGAQLNSSDNWRTGGGAAAGAIAGSMIAPGIGTIIGGLIGAVVGARSPDASREQFLGRAQPLISEAYDGVDALVLESLNEVRRSFRRRVDGVRKRYRAEWGGEITRLTTAHARRRVALATEIAAVEQAADGARRRREQVTALRHETARTTTVHVSEGT